jgi:hypothetical protein
MDSASFLNFSLPALLYQLNLIHLAITWLLHSQLLSWLSSIACRIGRPARTVKQFDINKLHLEKCLDKFLYYVVKLYCIEDSKTKEE